MGTYVRDLGRASWRSAAACAAFEVGFVPLEQARALVELYAEKGDRKYERAALKYLRRYLDESEPALADVVATSTGRSVG